MAKGYAHKEGIDYEENVSPIEKWGTILTLLDLATHNGQRFHQMDVNIAFLNEELKDNAYMSYLEDFVEKGQEKKV